MNIIIGITGTLGAGKGSVVDYLVKNEGFEHYSVREFLIEKIKEKNLPINRDSMVSVANDLRAKHGSSYLAEQLYEKASRSKKPVIIESLRTPAEIESLRMKGSFFMLAVDADPRIRYERVVIRGSETDKVSFEKFLEDEKRELSTSDPNKQNLSKCIEMADFKIDNSGSLEDLYHDVKIVFDLIKERFSNKWSGFKRQDYIDWDEYFMGVAMLSAMRSKDPSSQVGACIVNQDKQIVATGYNGWPINISDDLLPWTREGSVLDKKYVYVVHAEANAITNSPVSLKGSTIYVALHPCNECAKLIIQSGIKEVVYISNKYKDLDEYKASKKLLYLAGVKTRRFIPKNSSLLIDFNKINK